MGEKSFVVACIPAFNEEKTIAKVVLQTLKHVDRVIVCDDGSKDLTGEIAEGLGAEVIRHGRNRGYGVALESLFERVREINPDVMVTLDADHQHNPSEIRRVVEPILRGEADIVVGSRFLDEGSGGVHGYRRVGIKAITKLANATSYKGLTDAQSGFRAYSGRAVRLVRPVEQGMGVSTETLARASEGGLRIVEVPIKVEYEEGSPRRNPFYQGLDVVLSTVKHMSMRHPLIFYGVPGIAAVLVALGFWIWTFQIFAATRQVVTNIALVAIAATLVGLMLITTAVILWVLVSVVREKG